MATLTGGDIPRSVDVIGGRDPNGKVAAFAVDSTGGLSVAGIPSPQAAATEPGNSVSVGATSVPVVAANASRREVTICNDHATNVVYLSLGGTAVLNKGIRVAPGDSYYTNLFSGAITAIATGAGTNVCFAEV